LANPLHRVCGMGRGIFATDSLSGIYVVVLDADKDRRTLVGGILRYCGALVTPVETSDAAISVMALLKPDAVVVDFAQPDETGLAFVRSVRALKPEDGGMVPTVAIGDESEPLRDLARSRGYDAYLARPIDPWELCRVISQLLAG
jgi:CheY-like chemotaxis protein